MNILPQIVLENSKVKLVPLSLIYLDGLHQIAQETDLWKWATKPLNVKDELRQYIFKALEGYKVGTCIPFVILDKSTGNVAGCTRFACIVAEDKRLEIGYTWLGKEYHGTGLNKATKYEMLNHAFEVMGINRVELKTDALNSRSRKAIEKLGAKEEGVLRAHMICGSGRVRDTIYYSIIKAEWDILKKTVFKEFYQEDQSSSSSYPSNI